jgi:protein CpxP
MKVTIKSILLLFLMAGFSTNLIAQQRTQNPDRMRAQMHERMQQNNQGMNNHHMQLMAKLDLTEDQKATIQKMHVAQQKEIMTHKANIKEKHAQLQVLKIADNYDQNAINNVIDEISDLQATMMKQRAEHQQSIRETLTEEQRVKFDLFHQNASKIMRHKMKNK